MSLSISNLTQNIDLNSDAAIKELNTDDSEISFSSIWKVFLIRKTV